MMRNLKKQSLLTFVTFFLVATASAQQYTQHILGSGMDRAIRGHGVAAADFDNDGFIDLYFVTKNVNSKKQGGAPNFLFKNLGNGTFIDVAAEAGVEGIIDTVNTGTQRVIFNYGAAWADFDNDGDVDLFLTNKGANELYENLDDGTFRDITEQAGLGEKFRESTSAAWFDYDLDGDLDLYVSNYGQYGLILSAKNEFYRNNGDGTFADITEVAGVTGASEGADQHDESDWTYTTLVVDANRDGYPDLYGINDFGGNIFYLNEKNGTFRKATDTFKLNDPGHGMGGTLGDFDNDGRFDIYLTNIEDGVNEWNRLFQHTASGEYREVATTTGTAFSAWAWGTEFFDYDLDGWLDLYVVNGQNGEPMENSFYRNLGNGTFEDIAEQTGTNSTSEARGMCVADFNNDGRLEIVAANYFTRAHYYLNTTQGGHYLKIELIGTQSNRDAYGAIVTVEAGGRTFYRTNDGVHYLGQSKRPVHFGLGEATLVDRIEVQWPSGAQQTFSNITADKSIRITEGNPAVEDIITAVQNDAIVQPDKFSLQAYPNPVQFGTTIQINLPQRDRVRVDIYDVLGRKVSTIASAHFAAGTHTVRWSPVDSDGRQLSNGLYFIRVQTSTNHSTKSILVLK
mgnify:CR=1 FL=1